MPHLLHNLRGREEGQTLVEFAIAFPIQILAVLGIIQLSLIFIAKQVVNYAAFAAARAELVREDLVPRLDAFGNEIPEDALEAERNRLVAKAAAMICTTIAGRSGTDSTAYEPFRLPGWGLLVPAANDGLDKSIFAQAKTFVYVYRPDSGQWSCISHAPENAPDPSTLPVLETVPAELKDNDKALVVAVAHDYELVIPIVGGFFDALSGLRPQAGPEPESPWFADASLRWGAPHITLVDVGVQYRSVVDPQP